MEKDVDIGAESLHKVFGEAYFVLAISFSKDAGYFSMIRCWDGIWTLMKLIVEKCQVKALSVAVKVWKHSLSQPLVGRTEMGDI